MADNDPVPVEVRLVVWVNRAGWCEEFSVTGNEGEDYDFEEMVQDWVREECQEMVESDAWGNVTEVTK